MFAINLECDMDVKTRADPHFPLPSKAQQLELHITEKAHEFIKQNIQVKVVKIVAQNIKILIGFG